jgi:hypothetical protein
MKKIVQFIAFLFFLSGCAEKTHVLDTMKASMHKKTSTDSISNKKDVTVDKSVIISTKTADTNIVVTGKPVMGFLNTRSITDTGTVLKHFENEDADLDIWYNKMTGSLSAKSTPKPKKIPVHIIEKTTVNRNVTQTTDSRSSVKNKQDIKTDTASKHVTDHKDPSASVKSFKTIFIIILIIIVLGAGVFIAIRKNIKI